jgi:hypothetical protein
MQFEDMDAQCMMWRKLNIVVKKKRLGTLVFKGFMANNGQTNWNVVWIVYGTRYPMVKMVHKQ